MTEQEAIKIILNYSVYGCGYCHEGGDEIPKAFTTATKALEKQIPKKPVSRLTKGALQYKVHDCPICGEKFGFRIDVNYCEVCGQKIDWSEESE